MKILQIGKFWPVLGGVEKVMYDLASGLSERGFVCDMLCADAKGGTRVIKLNEKGRVMTTRTLFKAKATMISPSMVTTLRRIARNYDIIHVHHPDPMAALALRLSRYKGRVVLHWHSDILRQRKLLLAYKPLQHWLLNRADRVICTSPSYLEGSKALQTVRDKAVCVPIGVAPIEPDPEVMDRLRGLTGGRRVVLFLGRLVPYKGVDNLVLAAKSLPDDCLTVIAGSGPLEQHIHKLIADNGLTDRVMMRGRVDDAERNAWMGVASVLVLPSVEKTEAYGIALIEAMSTGLPTVATNIPGSGTSWVNAHGESGLNAPVGSPEGLAEAINGVLADESFSAGARRRWEQMFTVERMLDNMSEVYRSLV